MFTIRTYQPTDLEKIVALINAIDAIEKIEDGTSVEELGSEIETPGVNATENVFVAEDERHQIVGYAWSRLFHEPTQDSFRSWFAVHPSLHRTDLSMRLLTRMYTRAQERKREFQNPIVKFHTLVNVLETERLAVVKAFGMTELRRFWQMGCALDTPIPAPQIPANIVTRAFRLGEDDERLNDALNESFQDHFGSAPQPLETFQHWVRESFVSPELSLIAEDTRTREIAGLAINGFSVQENERLGIARGWVHDLGVRRPWRKQGLGSALLLQSLKNFRNAELKEAALGCDSENPTGATRIYERVGFRVVKTRIAFWKSVRKAESVGRQEKIAVT